jgi:uroporphyrinogen III methyltransferase / synthase
MKFPSSREGRVPATGSRGTVYLVGAGPGDPGLLTLRAARLLRSADVVVHDALVGERILDLIRPDARRIDVGKRCGGRRTPQERINQTLIEAAGSARVVVRLKGGDPFVFGRGGEEALALRSAGVRFEVVPGVTAAVGVSAYAGIPLTHRDFASSVTFVTGHEETGRRGRRVDWNALARLGGTLVIYMGMSGLRTVSRRLIEAGRSPDTPAAVIEWGTYARQRTVEAPLAGIAARAESAGVGAPALVVVGEVAALRREISWFDGLPLRGRRVVVVRSRAQPSRITRALRRLGADVAEFPKLRAEAIPASAETNRAFDSLAGYGWVLFSSPSGVAHFWRQAGSRGLDSRALGGIRVASLGLATSRALARRGITPDVATRTYVPAEVVRALNGIAPLAGAGLLFARDAAPSSPIADELRRAGARVDEIALFEFIPAPVLETAGGSTIHQDVVVLPSSSTARWLAGTAELSPGTRVVAIGPDTAQTALALGLPVHAVAGSQTVPGTVRAVIESLAMESGAQRADPVQAETPSGAL